VWVLEGGGGAHLALEARDEAFVDVDGRHELDRDVPPQ
jgi:hypothetical protein